MYKLLTDEAKVKISQEYARRRTCVMLAALVAVMVIGLAGLFPSFILSTIKKLELLDRINTINALSTSQGGDPTAWLNSINLKLSLLDPTLDTVRPAAYIEAIIRQKPLGIRLANFAWFQEGDNTILSVSGASQDRQTLLNFENNLILSGRFLDVVLPISNLAQDKNINFQIKLILPKNK